MERSESKIAKAVLCILLDAAELSFLKSNFWQLPNLRQFFDKQPVHSLNSGWLGGAVHTSFYSGRTPGEHGFFFQLQWHPEKMRLRPLSEKWVGPIPVFWRDLATQGYRVVDLDVPFVLRNMTTTAREIWGWSVNDPLEGLSSNIPGEVQRIVSRFDKNPLGQYLKYEKTERSLAKERDQLICSVKQKTEQACDMLLRFDWDLFLLSFAELHRGGHFLWVDDGQPSIVPQDALIDVCKAVDRGFGDVLAAAPPDCDVVVFALHGMSHQASQSHLIDDLLRVALEAHFPAAPPAPAQNSSLAWLRRNIPEQIQYALVDPLPRAFKDQIVARQYTGGLVPGKTRAFSMVSDANGYWRFLVKGREREGTLSEQEAASFRQGFAEILNEFYTESGEPLCARVHFPAEDYSGPRAYLLPDIAVEWNPQLRPVSEVFHARLGKVSAKPIADGRSGNHTWHGFFAHRGEAPVGVPTPTDIHHLAGYISALVKQRVSDT